MEEYMEMVSWLRRLGLCGFKEWMERFVEDLPGYYDGYSNYIVTVGSPNGLLFSVHVDTVIPENYKFERNVIIPYREDGHWLIRGNGLQPLGADDTNGVWILRQLIREGFPATYIFHQDEERGLRGSRYIAKNRPSWLGTFHSAIALDRKGYGDCITHMIGSQVCSYSFAYYLSDRLGLTPCNRGGYTDTFNYAPYIANCTNLSCGYFNEHTNREYADFTFCEEMVRRLLCLDADRLCKFAVGQGSRKTSGFRHREHSE